VKAEKVLNKWLNAKEFVVAGKGVTRTDALDKVLGRAKYVEDYFEKGMLCSSLVRSTEPHAKILKIDSSGLRELGCEIVTAEDIPGVNEVGYSIHDQPLLSEKKVRFYGDPIALVVSDEEAKSREGVRRVKIKYEPLPAIFDPLEAMKNSNVLVHEEYGSNIALKTHTEKGDIRKGFEESDVTVENNYSMGYQDHAYLETEGAAAFPEKNGIEIIASIQYPHLSQRITAKVLGIPPEKVKVVQACVGGAFGGKDDMGPLLCAQAALVAEKFKKPAMVHYTREDSMVSHCKRDPARIRYKTGAGEDEMLKAIEAEIIFDSGAYANRGPFTLWRATVHASGPYAVPNAKIDGYLVYTNKVFQGSFRGFGNPQGQFACESQMDEVAKALQVDPLEFRIKNMLEQGSRTLTNQVLEDPVGLKETLLDQSEKARWKEKRKRYGKPRNGKVKGIGVACGWHGISTSRGVKDWSSARIKIEPDGKVKVYTGITEIGQGSHTGHAQIVAEVLGVNLEAIEVVGGTTEAPDGGATHASRGVGIGGISILLAAEELRNRIEEGVARHTGHARGRIKLRNGKVKVGGKIFGWKELVDMCFDLGISLETEQYFSIPKGKFDNEKGQGFAYPAFSFIANIAEVEVDLNTGIVRVLRIWPALSAGKIINPIQMEGQVEGAVAQGLGYMLYEDVVIENGKVTNPNFTDYLIPTSQDVPKVEKPCCGKDYYRYGPFGAKGIGEMALIPTPPAISNAIFNACSVRIRMLPVTPEKLYWLLKQNGGK
jgi:CO/xanthine dehydrogenase Mo-binding subunit